MENPLRILLFLLCLLFIYGLPAQRVIYAPVLSSLNTTRFEVAGKAGNFYWVQKSKKNSNPKKAFESWINDKDLSFEIYDTRLNPVKTIPYTVSATILKEYLIAGNSYFDQLLFSNSPTTTTLLINRFTPEGNQISYQDTLATFNSNMKGNDFLLMLSEDKSKLLLLGFGYAKDGTPNLYSILFDGNWNVLYQTVYKSEKLSQPFVQYDFINYPLEYFDNSPVKLANNGDWLMLAPSRHNHNYSLFHFHYKDSSFISNEIKLEAHPRVQFLSLSLDNIKQEAFAGILLNSNPYTIKKTRIAHYNLSNCRIDFDTTYWFNTGAAGKLRDENLYEQSFMPVPGKGFMFLKEFGRPFISDYPGEDPNNVNDLGTASVAVTDVPAPFNKHDYTRYSNLSWRKRIFERGDLALYYFPAYSADSTWSGIINQEQTSDLNSADLSYVLLPVEDKLIFLYNTLSYNDNKFSSTTILDEHGHPMNEGIVFWKTKHQLDFQKARQILSNELAVPYEKNRLQGFAIIRLKDQE